MNDDFAVPDEQKESRLHRPGAAPAVIYAHVDASKVRAGTRLTAAQTEAAKRRVEPRGDLFTYWTVGDVAPRYATRREAEEASIQEWRDNL